MVAITKSLVVLLGAALALASAQTTQPSKPTPAPAPQYSSIEMSRVVDCQTQCVEVIPPFGNKPDINVAMYMKMPFKGRRGYLYKNMQKIIEPCTKNVRKLKGDGRKLTQPVFQEYVLCNSKTLTRNENVYFAKNFNWKKAGFTAKEWKEFRTRTLPGFRRALHTCRGGCRRIHFAHKGPPKP